MNKYFSIFIVSICFFISPWSLLSQANQDYFKVHAGALPVKIFVGSAAKAGSLLGADGQKGIIYAQMEGAGRMQLELRGLEKQNIKLLHVYFKGGNSKLKKQSKSLYQGYIASTNNTIDIELDRFPKKVEKRNLKQEKIPFNLSKDEAVLCFIKNGKKRYQKINLEEQQLKNIPM